MSSLSTHVLDTAIGGPAPGIRVSLSTGAGDQWSEISEGITDDNGRIAELGQGLGPGTHRLRFDTGGYGPGFYPFVDVVIRIEVDRDHYHIPLLLSPFGYSTYRGS